MNDENRKHQNQSAIDDFQHLDTKYLKPLMEQTLEGMGATINITLQIPVEHVILASWLELRSQCYQDKTEFEKPIIRLLNYPITEHEYRLAVDRITQSLNNYMALYEYHELCTQTHLYLYHRQDQNPPEESDDLPF